MSADEIFTNRKNKFLKIGRNKGFIANTEDLSSLSVPAHKFITLLIQKIIIFTSIVVIILVSLLLFYKLPQHFLYFLPDPHGQGSFLLTFLFKFLNFDLSFDFLLYYLFELQQI